MLLKFIIILNFIMLSSTFIGEMGPIYTKTPKIKHKWTWTTPWSIRSASASDFFGYLQYQYDDETTKHHIPSLEELEFEPVVNPIKQPAVNGPVINCDDFKNYAINCTMDSAILYNSTKKSPPMPAKMYDWCTAIRHLTNCAIDWNSECKDVTESHFNEESIKGHMHVINHICDDDWFLSHYDELPACIDRVSKAWEHCYVTFKAIVDIEKNTTKEWTHYLTHFYLCCARTRFRHCTLNALFLDEDSKCQHEEAVILQKFSVIVSEGDVFQDCETAMLFSSCPNGDPRPPTELLFKLMNSEIADKVVSTRELYSSEACGVSIDMVIVVSLIKFVL